MSARRATVGAITTRDGLSDDNINTIFEDREGNLWIGTNTGGLNRMKPRKLTAFSREQGLPGDGVVPVTEDAGRHVVDRHDVRRTRALSRRRRSRRTACRTDLPQRLRVVAARGPSGQCVVRHVGRRAHEVPRRHVHLVRKDNSNLASDAVLALYEDRRGVMWVGTSAGLHRFEHGVVHRLAVRDGLVADDVRFITEDREGALWMGRPAA